jgi:hypothetical protein
MSTPATGDRGHGEQGQILALVIAALVVVGALAAALVAQSTPSLVHTGVVSSLNDRIAAANAGIQYVLGEIKESPNNPNAICQNGQQLTGPSVNNISATVTCVPEILASHPGFNYVPITATAGNLMARAVVSISNASGSLTVESWRVCQDPQC